MVENAEIADEMVQPKPAVHHWFYPWLIWGLGAAFFFSEYLGRVAPSVVVPELSLEFHVSALSLGALSSMFLWPYIFMQMPVGMLVDRYGPHKLLTVTAALCGLGCFAFAMAEGIFLAQVGRFLMGFGAAFAFVGALKLATMWFCPTRFGLLAGLTQALGMLGAALGQGPLAAMVESLGWRKTMWLIGGILLIIATLIGFVVRDKHAIHTSDIQDPSEELASHISFRDAFSRVLKNPQSWLNGLYVGLIYAPTGAFAEFWGTTYVQHNNGLSKVVAAQAISCIFLGWTIGGPLAGMLSDRIKRRKPVMYISALLSLITMSAALYIPNLSVSILFLLMFLYGLSNTGVGVSYALAGEINDRKVAGTSLAFANMASIIIAAAFQPLIGWFLDLQWDGQLVNGIPSYSIEAYRYAMIALPMCLGLGVLSTFFVKETYCKLKGS
ncbi:MAG: MFS transporter [Pseudomonadota bacterium]|nr:MFS transporter [Pseudomonadota bacterium]